MAAKWLAPGIAVTLAGCIPSVEAPVYPDRPPPQPRPSPRTVYRVPPRYTPPPEKAAPPPRPGLVSRPHYEGRVSTLPAPRPAWEARAVAPDAAEVRESTYVVRAGDTLRGIAAATGAGADAIARANGIEPPFVVAVGQRLRIPGGRYHLVRSGETGIAIARAYGVEWSQVVAANGLEEPYILRAGQRVIIPGTNRPRSAAERAAAFTLDIDDILTGGEPALAQNEAPAKPSPTPRRVLPETAAVVEPAQLKGRFLWPVRGAIIGRFGPVRTGQRNDGINVAVPSGTPIKAAADGVVAYAGDGIAALGGLVIVRHGDGWTSVYGYASKLLVRRGQSVKRGDTIALSGESGATERPAVHFELRRGRNPVDPLGQLPQL